MRKAFIEALCAIAADDDRVMLLTGDLGFMVMEPFRERFPKRFINAGAAEQNMIGLATGLAEAGFIPYAYSIATFAALRPFEFIRNGPVLHQLPVRIVGMGAGFDYGHGGPSHYAIEDVAALRTLAGLTIAIPADSSQTVNAFLRTRHLPGPVYYSLGKDDRVHVPGLNGRFEIGRAHIVRNGNDIAIVAMGSIVQEAVAAAEDLASKGIQATVIVVSGFNPDPDDDLAAMLAPFRQVVTVEAQAISGGLAACVGSLIARRGLGCRMIPAAVHSSPDGTTGSSAERWRKYGLDRIAIGKRAMESLQAA